MTDQTDNPTSVIFQRWPLGGGPAGQHDVRGAYVERCWTSTLGPTSTMLLRLTACLLAQTDTVKVQAGDLAQLLGVGGGTSKWGVLAKSLRRLEHFGAARQVDTATWAVRSHLPDVPTRQLSRHGDLVRAFHLLLTSRAATG